MDKPIRIGKHTEWQEVAPGFWSYVHMLVIILTITKKFDGTYAADCTRLGALPTPASQLENYDTFEEAEASLFEGE